MSAAADNSTFAKLHAGNDEAEISDVAGELTKVVSSRRGLTFGYDCGNMSFGKPADEVKNAALYMRYVSENSFGARGVAWARRIPTN